MPSKELPQIQATSGLVQMKGTRVVGIDLSTLSRIHRAIS